jgi:hypothetical protein
MNLQVILFLGKISLSIPGSGARMLSLCKFVRMIKKNDRGNLQNNFRDGYYPISSKRDLSCHLVFLWKSMARFSLFWGGFINLLARKGRNT